MSQSRPDRPKTAALIVAAGRGVRAGGDVPKQYRPVLGRCALARSLALFAGHPEVDVVQPVIGEADGPLYAQLADAAPSVLAPVIGGATRQASVRAGLAALAGHAPDVVLIHDAARPFASDALVSRAIAAGRLGPAVPGVPVTDTIKAVDGAEKIESTVDRTRLRAVQTPQAFPFALIQDLHARAAAAGRDDFTDDAALAEWAGLPATVFAGEPGNIKLTTPEDFTSSEARLLAALADVRTGSGFDVHAFGDGRPRHARRPRHPAQPRPRRPFRRRRGAARADRRGARRHRLGRHRLPLPALRPPMEGRVLRPVPRPRRRAGEGARRARSPISTPR